MSFRTKLSIFVATIGLVAAFFFSIDYFDQNEPVVLPPVAVVPLIKPPAVAMISGTVFSSVANQPLINAEIFVNGSARVTTDIEGRFDLFEIAKNDLIRVRKNGYVEAAVIVASTSEEFTFELAPIWQLDFASEVYTDVPNDAWFEPAVRRLYETQTLTALQPLEFRPTDPVSRAELIVLTTRSAGFLPKQPQTTHFCDVTEDANFAAEAEFLFTQNWLVGQDSETCDLKRDLQHAEVVNRAEMIKLVLTVLNDKLPAKECEYFNFSDVPAGSELEPFVQKAKCLGLLRDDADDSFRPTESVSRAELAEILAKI